MPVVSGNGRKSDGMSKRVKSLHHPYTKIYEEVLRGKASGILSRVEEKKLKGEITR